LDNKLIRVGTTYIPVQDVNVAKEWYGTKLGATLNYSDSDKAIVDLADQAIFLVKAKAGETSNFVDSQGTVRFSLTFEVDGEEELEQLRKELLSKEVEVGEIEDRGHAGRNFVFTDLDGNRFDVWSCLSPSYKELRKKAEGIY